MVRHGRSLFCTRVCLFPLEGWALHERTPPSRLPIKAKEFLVELFEDGKINKNRRVSPDEAELKLRDKYPKTESYWLTKKQVKNSSLQSLVGFGPGGLD